jgi:hypothetical protein
MRFSGNGGRRELEERARTAEERAGALQAALEALADGEDGAPGPCPVLPLFPPPAGTAAADPAPAPALRRLALHPLTGIWGSAVAGLGAMIMTAILATAPVAGPEAAAAQPQPVPVIPAPHHHRRKQDPGPPGAAPSSPARAGTAARHSSPPSGRHSAAPSPSRGAAPRPSPSSGAPATFSPPGTLPPAVPRSSPPAPPAPQPSPSASSARPVCVRLGPLGVCLGQEVA